MFEQQLEELAVRRQQDFLMNQIQSEIRRIKGWGPRVTYKWLHTDNPRLGGISPASMVFSGRGEKLLKMIQQVSKH